MTNPIENHPANKNLQRNPACAVDAPRNRSVAAVRKSKCRAKYQKLNRPLLLQVPRPTVSAQYQKGIQITRFFPSTLKQLAQPNIKKTKCNYFFLPKTYRVVRECDSKDAVAPELSFVKELLHEIGVSFGVSGDRSLWVPQNFALFSRSRSIVEELVISVAEVATEEVESSIERDVWSWIKFEAHVVRDLLSCLTLLALSLNVESYV
ncbi:hypothetical protein BDZ45DRAFT_159066 [Acephala macrosclerotiorum]|nr:hypothetical protein BDZ45DRAFT_159066 [Acephala macrosclerotiorum]